MPDEERTEWKLTRKEVAGLRELQTLEGGYRELTRQVAFLLSEHRMIMNKWFAEVAKAHQIPVEFRDRLTADAGKGTVWKASKYDLINQILNKKD